MRSSGEGVGGENHRQFRGSTVGIDLELEDPVHGDAGGAVVGAQESEPAHARSRETEVSHGAGYLGFRESPAAGPGIGSVNPGAGVAHAPAALAAGPPPKAAPLALRPVPSPQGLAQLTAGSVSLKRVALPPPPVTSNASTTMWAPLVVVVPVTVITKV